MPLGQPQRHAGQSDAESGAGGRRMGFRAA